MSNKTKNILTALLACMLLSCAENVDNQSVAAVQDADATNVPIINDFAIGQPFAELSPFGFVEGQPATAPYLRSVMPNSWQNLTRLSPEDEALFLSLNTSILDRVATDAHGFFLGQHGVAFRNHIDIATRVYREQVGADVFFRLLTFSEKEPDFYNHDSLRFLQALVYNRNGTLVLLMMGAYGSWTEFESHVGDGDEARDGKGMIYTSLTIIAGRGRAKGVLAASVQVNTYHRTGLSIRNNHIYGHVEAFYMLMEHSGNITGTMRLRNRHPSGIYMHDVFTVPTIEITASPALVDPDSPLRHGLQNAFDGNPATAFVANAENDILGISLRGRNLFASTRKIAIINGCAQSMTSYRNNNRARTLSMFFGNFPHRELREIELADDTLSWQIIESDDPGFDVMKVYPGDRYNNTLVTGFNVYVDNYGWLFGDINE